MKNSVLSIMKIFVHELKSDSCYTNQIIAYELSSTLFYFVIFILTSKS